MSAPDAVSADPTSAVDSVTTVDAVDSAAPAGPGDRTAAPADEPVFENPAVELDRLRGEIERIDRALIALVAERVQLARRVGVAKHALAMPTLDPAREAAVVRRAGELAREAGLEDEDVRYIFWHLIGLSRRAQLQES